MKKTACLIVCFSLLLAGSLRAADVPFIELEGHESEVIAASFFPDGKRIATVSKCSRSVNTSFIERQNGTDRNRCSRKVRKSYCFSKDWNVHRAATCLTMYSYNFCWAVRTLRRPDGQKGKCTPAMAAGLAEHVWTIREWITLPTGQY